MILLNENCKFQCMNGNPSILITASEQCNYVARDGKKKILTEKARCKVKTPLPCSILTAMAGGVPTNCQLSQITWQNSNNKIKCNGHSVLTNMSTIMCTHGGIIKPLGTNCIMKIGATIAISDIVSKNVIRDKNVKVSASAAGVSLDDNKNKKSDNLTKNAAELVKKKEKSSIYASHTLCNYENCNERDSCEYFNSQIFVENSSTKLSANFQNNRNKEWQEYLTLHNEKNQESQNGNWRIAAHHMISGNQVLMMKDNNGDILYGEIVKLANYFGYDVNNEWNCIMLPTNENNFGQLELINKIANAYDVMWLMGRQWHVGGHQYSLDKDTIQNLTDFYKKHPEQYLFPGNPELFSNYKTAMKEEMDKLLLKYSRIQCWKKGYTRKKQKFFDDMNKLSAKIEKYLLNFRKNPRKSFPFFVSKIAVEYAYDLPATSKIIVVYSKGKKLRAKRVRMERYMKNALKPIPVEKDDIEINEKKEFIVFCENVMYFFIDNQLKEFELPFSSNADIIPIIRKIDFGGEPVMKYLMNHGNEIMAFINQNVCQYQPIAKVVGMRGGINGKNIYS